MTKTNGFSLGQYYSRRQIHKILGGGTQDYLPHKNLHVVCGCFRPDLNPRAPSEILPATRPDIVRWAEVFQTQPEGVPIFLKRATNKWEYRGDWRCASAIKDRKVIAKKQKQSGRSSISMVLKLDQVSR